MNIITNMSDSWQYNVISTATSRSALHTRTSHYHILSCYQRKDYCHPSTIGTMDSPRTRNWWMQCNQQLGLYQHSELFPTNLIGHISDGFSKHICVITKLVHIFYSGFTVHSH
jgi:hypothetical protein